MEPWHRRCNNTLESNECTDGYVCDWLLCVCLTDDEVEPEEIEEVDEFEPKKSKGTINIEFDTGDVSDTRQLQDEWSP